MRNPEIQPKKPDKCPICGENYLEAKANGFDIYGDPADLILELQGTEAKAILIRGWECHSGTKRGVFGTVLSFIRNGKLVEHISPDHTYIIFPGDKVIY